MRTVQAKDVCAVRFRYHSECGMHRSTTNDGALFGWQLATIGHKGVMRRNGKGNSVDVSMGKSTVLREGDLKHVRWDSKHTVGTVQDAIAMCGCL
ncbi:hypothetical protein PPGU19_087340 (plasmid) [Paraburkholderia sp. PGU19]|nr:hypothetical protein PPGU19_087340 [Paraburkholderia sp. PGU19]